VAVGLVTTIDPEGESVFSCLLAHNLGIEIHPPNLCLHLHTTFSRVSVHLLLFSEGHQSYWIKGPLFSAITSS
jgi:hypothetical protein